MAIDVEVTEGDVWVDGDICTVENLNAKRAVSAVVPVATEAEAVAGVAEDVAMPPLRVAQAIADALGDTVTKLAGIEEGAEVNLTNAEVKAAYEANSNTNAFTDTYKSKLNGIESGADVNPTNAETKAAYEANSNTNAFTDAEKSKLAGLDADFVMHVGVLSYNGSAVSFTSNSGFSGVSKYTTADFKVTYANLGTSNFYFGVQSMTPGVQMVLKDGYALSTYTRFNTLDFDGASHTGAWKAQVVLLTR